MMTDNELKIYRKIAVWRSLAVCFLILMLAAIPAMFVVYGIGGDLGISEDDVIAVVVLLILLDLILFIPYAVCVNRLIVLTGYEPPFILSACLAGVFTWPFYILLSVFVLEHSQKVLRQVQYMDDDFSYGDSNPFSGTSPECPNRSNDTHPLQNYD